MLTRMTDQDWERVVQPAFPRYLSPALTVSVNSAKIISSIWAMTGASNGSDVG